MMVKGQRGPGNTVDARALKKAKILLHDENLMQLETNLLEKLHLAHNQLHLNNPFQLPIEANSLMAI